MKRDTANELPASKMAMANSFRTRYKNNLNLHTAGRSSNANNEFILKLYFTKQILDAKKLTFLLKTNNDQLYSQLKSKHFLNLEKDPEQNPMQ